AKLIGPSIARFLPGDTEVAGILGFLSDLDEQYGVSLDAVSWHENDSANIGGYFPEDIPQHAQIIRNGIEAIFGPDYRPQLHINEYAGSRVHLSPGWNVGYIYYLIESEIDGAMRSCWTVLSGQASELWSDCWDGLNGMFMNDALTPTHAYWVYQHYAKMAGGQRLLTVSTSPRTTVVAARDDGEEVLRTLVGRYWQGGSSDVTVRFASYPYQHASVLVEVGRIPHHAGFFADPPIILPLPDGPVDPTVVTRDVVGGAFDVILQGFRSNEAYLITVTGDEITAAGERLPLTGIDLVLAVPNPFVRSAALRFQLPRTEDVFLAVYDPAGRRVATVLDGQLPAGSHVSVWDGRDDAGRPVASGTYIVRLAAGREVAHSHLVLVK
ncbi:MAG: FlgD immunoglobulin-like domain containing protein, partial [Planctomycetota bacterium]